MCAGTSEKWRRWIQVQHQEQMGHWLHNLPAGIVLLLLIYWHVAHFLLYFSRLIFKDVLILVLILNVDALVHHASSKFKSNILCWMKVFEALIVFFGLCLNQNGIRFLSSLMKLFCTKKNFEHIFCSIRKSYFMKTLRKKSQKRITVETNIWGKVKGKLIPKFIQKNFSRKSIL